MKTSRVFFEHKFKSLIKSRLFWADTFIMLLASALAYFTGTRFFTASGTSSLTAYFSYIPYVSILVIPSLCMKSRYSYDDFVPVSNFLKLILNFSAYFLAFAVMLVLLMWMPVFVSFCGDVDWGAVAVSFFALLFYGASAVSLCFLVSEFFEKSAAGFIVSSLLLAAINSCHNIPQFFALPVFLSDFFYGLSFAGRFDSASKGILSSADFLYFLIISSLFLFLSLRLREKKKGFVPNKILIRRNVYIIFLFLFLFLNSRKYFFKIDFSEDKLYSISAYTEKLLKETEETVTLRYYKSSKLENLYPSVKNVSAFLRNYGKAGKNLKLIVIDCDKDEIARNLLNNYGIYPQRIRTENSTSTEFIDVYSSIILESGGNIDAVPFVLNTASLEYQLDLKLLKICHDYRPVVNIFSANGMTLSDDLRLLNDWFVNQDIEVKEISYSDFAMDLSDVQGPLFVFGEDYISAEMTEVLENYVSAGKGNVLFLNSPYSVDLKGDWSVKENQGTAVTDLLSRYGVSYNPSMVMDYSCQRISMMSEDSSTDYAEILNYPLWLEVLPQTNSRLGFSMFWTSPLEFASDKLVPLIVSSSHAYKEPLNFDSDYSLIETNPFKVNMKNVQTNTLQNYILACFIPVSNEKSTYNVHTNNGFYVISDQYFSSYYTNAFIGGENGDFRNFIFLSNLFWKMNGNEALAVLQGKTASDRTLYKRKGK